MYKILRTTWALMRELGVLRVPSDPFSVTVTILSIPLAQLRGVIITQRLSVASNAIDHPSLGHNNNNNNNVPCRSLVLQVLQHRRIRQTPGTFAIAPFGRLLRPAVAYGDGYSNPPIPGDFFILHIR